MPPDPITARKSRIPICALCNHVCIHLLVLSLSIASKFFTTLHSLSLLLQDITSAHYKCADSEIDMCMVCLMSGVEVSSIPLHRRTSPYRVMDNWASMRLYEPGWSVADEFALLEAIEIYGLGNWRDCASYVGGDRTDSQVSRHYSRVYLEGPMAPLPSVVVSPMPIGSSAPTLAPSSADETMGSISGEASEGGSGVASASAATAAVASSTAPARDRGSGRVSATPGHSTAHIPRTEISGYLPLRGDFDVEWENDAEAVLGDLDFIEGEHTTETELKLKILEIYNAKLDERERRKAFIIERGLLDYKRLLAVERRRPKEEREIYDAFRPFARFLSPKEHEELVRGVILEHRCVFMIIS